MGDEEGVVPTSGKPIDRKSAIQDYPDTLEKRPQHAAMLANICQAWALVEHNLIELYGLYMGLSLPPIPNAAQLHPVAFETFLTLPALQNRTTLLVKLARSSEAPDDELQKLVKLIERVTAASKQRNRVVHGLWGISDEYPDDLILQTRIDGDYLYRVKDLQEIFDAIKRLHGSALHLIMQVVHRIAGQNRVGKPPRSLERPTPAPEDQGRK